MTECGVDKDNSILFKRFSCDIFIKENGEIFDAHLLDVAHNFYVFTRQMTCEDADESAAGARCPVGIAFQICVAGVHQIDLADIGIHAADIKAIGKRAISACMPWVLASIPS